MKEILDSLLEKTVTVDLEYCVVTGELNYEILEDIYFISSPTKNVSTLEFRLEDVVTIDNETIYLK